VIDDSDTENTEAPLSLTLKIFPRLPLAPIFNANKSPVPVVDDDGDQSTLASDPVNAVKLAVEPTWNNDPDVKPVPVDPTYNPVPVVSEFALKAKADVVVEPDTTDELKLCAPVPELNINAVAPVVLPVVIVLALAPVPMFMAPVVPLSIFNEPVVVVPIVKLLPALVVEIVWLPDPDIVTPAAAPERVNPVVPCPTMSPEKVAVPVVKVCVLFPKAMVVSVPADASKVHVVPEPEPNVVVPISVVSRFKVRVSVADATVSIPFVPPIIDKVSELAIF
jgi:hypothetical protein